MDWDVSNCICTFGGNMRGCILVVSAVLALVMYVLKQHSLYMEFYDSGEPGAFELICYLYLSAHNDTTCSISVSFCVIPNSLFSSHFG